MKRFRILLIVIFIGISIQGYSQCPPYDINMQIVLKSQEQVDSLLANYPNCTEIEAPIGFTILTNTDEAGTPVHDLTPLQQLTKIKGLLVILGRGNALPSLESLSGLNNITSLDGIVISENDEIIDLAPLNQVDSIANLRVTEMEKFESLSLGSLKVSSEIIFRENPQFKGVGELTVEDKLFRLKISENPNLNIESDLSNLKIVTHELELNHHDISFVRNLEDVGSLKVHGNGPVQDLSDFTAIVRINENLELNSLLELKDFAAFSNVVYPESFGSFRLYENSKLKNILGLDQIKEMSSLHLLNSPLLTEVSIFRKLENIAIMLVSNTGLQDLANFNSLEKVLGHIGFHENKNLISLSGLGKLTNIDKQLVVAENENLQNLDGLSNLVSFGINNSDGNFLTVRDNASLTSITSLANTFGSLETISIENNPELNICHLPIICTHILEGKETTIENNGPGCSSIKETEDQCSNPIFQKIYYDRNENATFDNEISLKLGHTTYNNDYKLFPNNQGVINLSPFPGEIKLEYQPKNNWHTTTEDDFFLPDSENAEAMFIGIHPTDLIDDLNVHLTYNPIICSNSYNMMLTVHNSGTTIVGTDVHLSGIGHFVTASLDPLSADSTTVSFQFFDLLPGETKEISLLYIAPNITEVPLGTELKHKIDYDVFSETDDFIFKKSKSYVQELLCAYDPNDKQVFPAGIGPENKTLKTDELQYLIRFQNTGNYYAEDITIRDTLDENLDLSTFKFVSASHPISEIKMERNALAFVFENIFLPDSIRDEPGSHGFVSYSIQAIEEIEEKAVIENTAHIYFDSNPPIVTNTVDNMMVTSLENEVATNDIKVNSEFLTFPNPASDKISVKSEENIGKWMLLDSRSSMIKQGNEKTSLLNIDLETIPDGIYFFKTKNLVEKIVVLK